jgi:hypothetical protein
MMERQKQMETFTKKSSGETPVGMDAEGTPIRARWSLGEIPTADGHRVLVVFSCSLRVLPERAEQKVFLETFLRDAPAIKSEEVLAHFKPGLAAAAATLAVKESVVSALDSATQSRWLETLRATADATAFACGIGLLAPFSLDVTSPSLEAERLQQMQRAAALRRSTERAEHFQRAAELLGQWESMKASSPALTPGRVLEQLNPTDRGAMLETLLMGAAEQGEQPDLWVVGGAKLVRVGFGRKSGSSQYPFDKLRAGLRTGVWGAVEPQLISAPTGAGPLRSVRWSGDRLMVGAQKGVMVYGPGVMENPEIYLDPELSSEHGFSGVALGGDGIWACHREGGVVFWNMGCTDRPSFVVRGGELMASAKLGVCIPESNAFLFAVGARLMSVAVGRPPATVADLSAAIVSILMAGDQAIVVTEDGLVGVFDVHSWTKKMEMRPVREAAGAALLPWLGSVRILLTTSEGPIYCVGLEDQLVSQYRGPHLGMRTVAGSVGKVAAMSSDRQRVILWNTWDGRQPVSEIHLASLTRHRIADIAM